MPTDQAKLVRYIRDMAKMANDASLDLLAYLLSLLVVLEADSLNASELAARSGKWADVSAQSCEGGSSERVGTVAQLRYPRVSAGMGLP
jgi:hypothetical protein